jgi:hypothetical protein
MSARSGRSRAALHVCESRQPIFWTTLRQVNAEAWCSIVQNQKQSRKHGMRLSGTVSCLLGVKLSAHISSKSKTTEDHRNHSVLTYFAVIGSRVSMPQPSRNQRRACRGWKPSVWRSGAKRILYQARDRSAERPSMGFYRTDWCRNLVVATASKRPSANRFFLHGSFTSARAFRTPGMEQQGTHERHSDIEWASKIIVAFESFLVPRWRARVWCGKGGI